MDLTNASVMCAIPTRDGRISEDVRNALAVACHRAKLQGVQSQFKPIEDRYCVAAARNRAVAKFLKSEHTHLLFVDDDVRVHQDTITLLLECGSDIAAGCYVLLRQEGDRMWPVLSCKRFGKWLTQFFSGTLDVDAAGTGCMLIRREVFADVGDPGQWFRWPTWLNADGDFEYCSDDVDFCNRASAASKTLVAHGDVRCNHARNMDLTLLMAIHQVTQPA